MPKRRAGVTKMIFELDEHESETESDDDVVQVTASRPRSKRTRGAAVRAAAQRLASIKKAHAIETDCVEVIDLDSSDIDNIGGKAKKSTDPPPPALAPPSQSSNEEADKDINSCNSDLPDPNVSANVIDSIESDDNQDNAVVAGCENRVPLITVKFKDKKLAKRYKAEVEQFLLSLLRWQHKDDEETEDDTDLELDIWPNDVENKTDTFISEAQKKENPEEESNLFFVDKNPDSNNLMFDIPQYSQSGQLLKASSNEDTPTKPSRSQCCFNCDGDHLLHQCPVPKNYARISQARKAMAINNVKVGRYHVEDEQKYGHLVAGRISGKLRHALGLKRDEMPLHIYRMRLLGYPPGWLQEARIQHSGISMFDSEGQVIQDPEEEEGELSAPGSKDKFDIKKILDYPGFNVKPSSRYKEGAHKYGLPPMSERDSKMLMLATLAPNAMQAYKRKKLTLFPSATNGDSSMQAGTADMDIASDEETSVEFPSVPPLPDEAPPPAPPPPPPPEETKEPTSPKDDTSQTEGENSQTEEDCKQKSQCSSGRSSPSLTDLEEHKQMLLKALHSSGVSESQDSTPQPAQKEKENSPDAETPKGKTVSSTSTPKVTPKVGQVKHSDFGTPVVNVASPYIKLPSDDKFAKDICDVINFENLPDSTGAYKKMSALLRRVKDEVTKIQDS